MAYYSQQQIKDLFEEVKKEDTNSMITPEEEISTRLNNKEDIVGFFWMTKEEDGSPKMDGNTFVRLGDDLYTDDRLAIDMYQSQVENKSLPQIIKEREKVNSEMKKAREEMKEEDIEKIKNLIEKDSEENSS